ncbi:MAG: hypothetical protein OXD31_08340 [Chloroflexi bacterium]|nr:hypothetical protein [Chloroflexota bacterium]
MTIEGRTSHYVVCKCSHNSIKLNLPIVGTPDGTIIACTSCLAALDECSPAPVQQVIDAGLPLSN